MKTDKILTPENAEFNETAVKTDEIGKPDETAVKTDEKIKPEETPVKTEEKKENASGSKNSKKNIILFVTLAVQIGRASCRERV